MLPNPDRQRRRYPRSVAGAGAVLIAALAALLIPLAASAQEPRVMAFEQPASGTITLQPGVNEVGWLAESADPQDLFDEIPQLETIWTWHTLDQRWQAAARDVPSNLWTLYRLVPGMGLRLQIASNEPINWQRSLVPASGKVELQPGNNFVAWAGRDGWDINQLAKGIGRQLQEIYSHNPDTGEHDAIWPVAEGAEPTTVTRGAALWIKMPRSIVWLQPTDILPRLVFPGGAPANVQAAATRDLRNTLDYFATEYGIQADFAEFSMYIPADADALKYSLNEDGHDVDDEYVAGLLDSNGVSAEIGIVVRRQDGGAKATDVSYQSTITHEYFHRIQRHLRNSGNYDALWIVEGSARYSEWDQEMVAGERAWLETIASARRKITLETPDLADLEGTILNDPQRWEYDLGALAIRQLVEVSSPEAWITFYRELAPTTVDQPSHSAPSSAWQDVFVVVFGILLDEFYGQFQEWQATTAADNERRTIRGQLFNADDEPLSGVWIYASSDSGGASDTTGNDGAFAMAVLQDGAYRLSINLADGCTVYLARGGITADQDAAVKVRITGEGVYRSIRIPAGWCQHSIRGRLLNPDGEPLNGIRADILRGLTNVNTDFTDGDGVFELRVARAGEYRLLFELSADCRPVLFARGRATTNWNAAARVRVADEDVQVGDIRIPAGTCGLR